jgi:hypothetical protein
MRRHATIREFLEIELLGRLNAGNAKKQFSVSPHFYRIPRKTQKRIDTIQNLKIEIYPNDHLPAHFHVVCEKFDARFEIDDIKLNSMKRGEIDSKSKQIIIKWAQKRQMFLRREWDAMRPTSPSRTRLIKKFQKTFMRRL